MALMSSSGPWRIVDVLCAYWQSAALTAAIELGVFSALGRRARTAGDLATACRANRRSIERLCDYLVSLGLLRVRQGRYTAAADAARFLDAGSPNSLVSLPRFFNSASVTAAFASLAGTVKRRGRSAALRVDPRLWSAFADSMLELRRRDATTMAGVLRRRGVGGGRILDVGAGASPLGVELLRRRRTASLVALDRAPVLRRARAHAAAAGVGARLTTLPGDALTADWGGPFDLVLMVNVLDYFDARAQARLLRKARTALGPGGTLIVAAPMRGSGGRPADAAAYDLLLLALGSTGRPSTWAMRKRQLQQAGFAGVSRDVATGMVLARVRR